MKKFIFICIILLLFFACKKTADPTEEFEYSVPNNLNDGLNTGHLADVGIKVSQIMDLGNAILTGPYSGVDSVLIIKGGRLVLESYFNHWNMDIRHDIMSCTKSIVSAAFGIAKDKGFINSVEDKLFDFIPEYSHLKNQSNQNIRLSHLLTMSAGFEWNQSPPFDSNNNLVQMINSSDAIEYILERPIINTPGQEWNYNGGCTQLLAEIILNTTGIEANTYADTHLFKPLGITDYQWNRLDDDRPNADYGLLMRPRDMAKIGLLFLNKGLWQGTRIISEKWIIASTRGYQNPYESSRNISYGYQWWVNPFYYPQYHQIEHYSALGNGGQCIIVFPSLDMVVVFTQNYYNRSDNASGMVNGYILPAVL